LDGLEGFLSAQLGMQCRERRVRKRKEGRRREEKEREKP
jgi:hypothetical protein